MAVQAAGRKFSTKREETRAGIIKDTKEMMNAQGLDISLRVARLMRHRSAASG